MVDPEKRKLSDIAEQHIRSMMIRGAIDADERLSDLTLSRDLEISRTPVREAIRRLVREGLAEHRPGLGVYVRVLTREEIEDLYDLRALLEGYAAEKAAVRATEAHLARMRKVCADSRDLLKRMRGEPQVRRTSELGIQMVKLDVQFHHSMLLACNSSQVLQAAGELRLISECLGHFWKDENADFRRTSIGLYRDHCRILRAIERHDQRAAADLVRRHIQAGRDTALAMIDRAARAKAAQSRAGWADKVRSSRKRSREGRAWQLLADIV